MDCLFVSLLSHFWLINFFHLYLLYQPYLGICQAQCVQSHQRQPMSAVAITAREVQVSAADSQTVPTVANINTDQWEPIVIYHSIACTGLYTTMQPTLLTSWLQLLSYKVQTITAEVCTVTAAIASASVGGVPVGYSTFHVDLAS